MRIIARHRALDEAVAGLQSRGPFYARVVTIESRPLRRRTRRHSALVSRSSPISWQGSAALHGRAGARRCSSATGWTGNVRELRNVLEQSRVGRSRRDRACHLHRTVATREEGESRAPCLAVRGGHRLLSRDGAIEDRIMRRPSVSRRQQEGGGRLLRVNGRPARESEAHRAGSPLVRLAACSPRRVVAGESPLTYA